jgi:hypothetical protein
LLTPPESSRFTIEDLVAIGETDLDTTLKVRLIAYVSRRSDEDLR